MHLQFLRGLTGRRGFGAGAAPLAFNPGLIADGAGYLLFYRLQQPAEPFTSLSVVRLDDRLRVVTRPQRVAVPKISAEITSFEDPRAFRWRGDIWLMHNQASLSGGIWSTSLVVGRYADGRITDLSVPLYGQNRNRALDPAAPPAFEKNWTPLVIGDDLCLVYEMNPLTMLKYDPARHDWQLQSGPGPRVETGWDSYLSGSTPLIPWGPDQQIAMFHTYQREGERRLYHAGFWLLNTRTWRVSALSPAPVLSGWKDRIRDHRQGRRRFLSYDPVYQVVFPAGIAWAGEDLLVSFGWNDSQAAIARFSRAEVEAALQPLRA